MKRPSGGFLERGWPLDCPVLLRFAAALAGCLAVLWGLREWRVTIGLADDILRSRARLQDEYDRVAGERDALLSGCVRQIGRPVPGSPAAHRWVSTIIGVTGDWATREEAEAAVLAWARRRAGAGVSGPKGGVHVGQGVD
jgi:hypothetical protein